MSGELTGSERRGAADGADDGDLVNQRHGAVAEHFATNAESWRSRYFETGFDADRYLTRARIAASWLQRLRAAGSTRLLEVGCGAGVQAESAVKGGWDVTAVDLSHEVVCGAARNVRGPHWVVAAAEALPFPAASYDAVLMLGLLGYVNDPAATLRATRRLLRGRGHIILTWRSPSRPLLDQFSEAISAAPVAIYRRLKRLPRAAHTDEPGFYDRYDRLFTRREMLDLLASAGFETVACRSHDFGRIRFAGKRLWPESFDIALTRAIAAAAAHRPLTPVSRLARLHIAMARVRDPDSDLQGE